MISVKSNANIKRDNSNTLNRNKSNIKRDNSNTSNLRVNSKQSNNKY